MENGGRREERMRERGRKDEETGDPAHASNVTYCIGNTRLTLICVKIF